MSHLLGPKDIQKLATGPWVKTIVVENFLSSLDNALPMGGHLESLKADAKSYGWNAATVRAIRDGILRMYKKP